jgi:hypothetical protein
LTFAVEQLEQQKELADLPVSPPPCESRSYGDVGLLLAAGAVALAGFAFGVEAMVFVGFEEQWRRRSGLAVVAERDVDDVG